jgi:hypothetical protein
MALRPAALPAFGVFVVAARHQNFAHAAEELDLTASAVSHHVRTAGSGARRQKSYSRQLRRRYRGSVDCRRSRRSPNCRSSLISRSRDGPTGFGRPDFPPWECRKCTHLRIRLTRCALRYPGWAPSSPAVASPSPIYAAASSPDCQGLLSKHDLATTPSIPRISAPARPQRPSSIGRATKQ